MLYNKKVMYRDFGIGDLTIPKYLPPRNQQIIANSYSIINHTYPEDFHCVVYYLTPHKIQIIVRRLDIAEGWNKDLQLEIKQNNNRAIISIGSSASNYCKIEKELDISFNITARDNNYSQLIPKKIIQTSKSNKLTNLLHYNAIMTFIEKNPEYEYVFFDDNDSRNFISKHFSKYVIQAYDIVNAGAFKADLFRYCYLYIHGGCYFDCKYILYHSLYEKINNNDTIILCKDDIPNALMNSNMMMTLGINRILDMINQACKYIHSRTYNRPTLGITGPVLLWDFFKHIAPKFFFIRNLNTGHLTDSIYSEKNIHSKKYFKTSFNGYYENYNSIFNKTRYDKLYEERKMYK
jgi:mannosyltransferase OCH1-like enzyme